MSNDNISKKNEKTSVAIIAIAKDESAYLTEWIHHHLYFGFTGIFIGINRTSDSSKECVSKITKIYKNVFAYEVDWIDQGCMENKNKEIQSLAYAYLTTCASQENKYTHYLYIDIDEFWFPNDFNSTINKYINSINFFDAVSFNWLMQYGDQDPFSKPFANQNCQPRRQIKSLVRADFSERIFKYRCHFPKIKKGQNNYIHFDANGNRFVSGEHEQISKDLPSISSKAFILHRAYRSEIEYIALLRRENPETSVPIKNNRKQGFNFYKDHTFPIESNKLIDYWGSLDEMVSDCDVIDIIEQSKLEISNKASTIFDVDIDIIVEHMLVYNNALKGTLTRKVFIDKLKASAEVVRKGIEDSNVRFILNHIENYNRILLEVNLVEALLMKLNKHLDVVKKHPNSMGIYKCAIFCENSGDNHSALAFCELALIARPNGDLIRKKRDTLAHSLKS